MIDLEKVLRGYVNCALWSTTDDEECTAEDIEYRCEECDACNSDSSLSDNGYTYDDIESDTLKDMRTDVYAFVSANYDYIMCLSDTYREDDEMLGHDFWLSRNGHGAGFFDRGEGAIGDLLQEKAREYGEYYLYSAVNGQVCN